MVDQVADRYLIDDKIGEGAYAVVYKARDLRINRTVAVKVLRKDHIRNDHSWARLLAEGHAAAALNHPNICRLYDIGEEQDADYVVLEFIEGQTLKTILQAGPLPVYITLRAGIQIAEALAHAHSAGILHRDLTSSNVMITSTGEVKVIDFGLARSVDDEEISQAKKSHSSMEEVGWLGGTLPYMAAEILHGRPATAQSDIWSLGVLMYEMLTGKFPFAGRTPFELSTAIMMAEIEPLPISIPPALGSIVCRCLAKDTAVRYSSALAVCKHLKAEMTCIEGGMEVSNCSLYRQPSARCRILASLLISYLPYLQSEDFRRKELTRTKVTCFISRDAPGLKF